MKAFYDFLGDAMHEGPSDWMERSTSWVVAILGLAMLGVMVYAIVTAWM